MRIDKQVDQYIGHIPQGFHDAVQQTLSQLPPQKKRHVWQKAITGLAAALVLFLGVAAANPAFARAVGMDNIFTWMRKQADSPEREQAGKIIEENAKPLASANQETPKTTLDLGEYGQMEVEVTDYYHDGRLLKIAFYSQHEPIYLYDDSGKKIGFIEVVATLDKVNGKENLFTSAEISTLAPYVYTDGYMLGSYAQDFETTEKTLHAQMTFSAERSLYEEKDGDERVIAKNTIELDIPMAKAPDSLTSIDQTFDLALCKMTVESLELLPTETRINFTLSDIQTDALRQHTKDGELPPVLRIYLPDGTQWAQTKWVDFYKDSTATFKDTTLPLLQSMPESLTFKWLGNEGEYEIPGMSFTLDLTK